MPAERQADRTLSTLGFIAANDRMHQDRAIPCSGNGDADLLRGMIPHHQDAVEMARRGQFPRLCTGRAFSAGCLFIHYV